MGPKKRMRVFAGPNGSGKTTIINDLRDKISFGVYVNADDIERMLIENHALPLDDFKLQFTAAEILNFFAESTLSRDKYTTTDLERNITVEGNRMVLDSSISINSYFAADIAEFLRQKLLEADERFTFETVMSHPSKIDFFKKALARGYRVYLYYIATEDPEINIGRVSSRVAQHGHQVAPEKIKSRYYRSLENLKQAVKHTSRAYLFDNSGDRSLPIAEVTNGTDVEVYDPEKVPNWFVRYLFE